MKNRLNILVLGGCGFIGSHMSELLVNEGHNVRIFDKYDSENQNIKNIISKVEFIKGDFSEPKYHKKLLKDIDYVFHFIANTVPQKTENFSNELKKDIMPTVNFLNSMLQYKVKKIIFSSSGGTVYGNNQQKKSINEKTPANPISSYGLTKLIIEKYMEFFHHQHGLAYSIARTSNCYGERHNLIRNQGAVEIFLKNTIEGKSINIWGDGSNVRDYINYKDVIKGMYLLLINKKSNNNIFNFGTGTGTSISELIAIIKKITNKKIKIKYNNQRRCDVQWNVLDCKKAKRELGWEPEIKLHDGIKQVYLWLRNQKVN